MTNDEVARRLLEHASELRQAGEMLYRIRAYRSAAFHIQHLHRPLVELFAEGGRAALEAVPGIGRSLAYTVEKLLQTGQVQTLRDLESPPHRQLRNLPDVGHRLAERLFDRNVRTPEQLQQALGEDTLVGLGMGPRQREGLRRVLARRLVRPAAPSDEPALELLLELDDAFRRQPQPVPLVTQREGWQVRVRLADTAVAHRRGMVNDWVLIDFVRGGQRGQRTVVTQDQGELRGQRVVRGREAEHLVQRRASGSAA